MRIRPAYPNPLLDVADGVGMLSTRDGKQKIALLNPSNDGNLEGGWATWEGDDKYIWTLCRYQEPTWRDTPRPSIQIHVASASLDWEPMLSVVYDGYGKMALVNSDTNTLYFGPIKVGDKAATNGLANWLAEYLLLEEE